MAYFCGIDIGASAAKLVLLDETGRAAARSLQKSGVDYAGAAQLCLASALSAARLTREQVRTSVSTGYGRDNVPWADATRTEIACHGKGAYRHFRRAMTVIDIGAQDSKIIHLNDEGRCTGFKMNRKCAAGTGAFLEEIAYRLDLPLPELSGLAEGSEGEVALGSFCTVFAATEVLARIRAGDEAGAIVKGAFRSVVKRVLEMDTVDGTVVLTGGVVAHNPIVARLVEETFRRPVLVPPEPQYAGALGAALFAIETAEKGQVPC